MVDQPVRIFLLSHMRAFSSLIGHILGSHAEINGYYELHISYRSDNDCHKQQVLLSQQQEFKPDSQFLFDKLLHNDYELDLAKLKLTQPKILVALRPPEQSIKSIVKLFRQKKTVELYSTVDCATEYYITRLNKIVDFCRQYPQQYHYFDAQLLTSSPQFILPKLTEWLGLKSPLSDQYQLFSKSGKAGAGDSSKSIQSGKILKSENTYNSIELPSGILQKAESLYETCRSIMINSALDSALK